MTPRIITADVARELLHGATEGPWEVGVASSWQGSVRIETEMYVRRPGDNVALAAQVIDPRTEEISESNARLLAAAPDLAHTVVAQAAELASLRASIDGRTTPPTDEEIAAHCGAGGRWRSIVPGDFILSTGDGDAEDAQQTSAVQHANADIVTRAGVRWWAIDSQGRCSAWPVVAEASR